MNPSMLMGVLASSAGESCDYSVSEDDVYDGDYSAEGAGYYVYNEGTEVFDYNSGGSRQVYAKNGDTSKKLFYADLGGDFWVWAVGTPSTGYLEDFEDSDTGTTPPTGSWEGLGGYITLTAC